ncbi:N-acetylmuramoyl-L-alanine amidase [Falsirhodobacter sp. alg1]|uniref:N-acetylmuramoyl-L-alanine amidase n=1 Tax=Falsirhodobacter sp. alg1 TaxID=1472418 RepID=UPI0005ED897A|nr:N-acetylmuramoyl-L-alanine amidase [Falsirhodobacter sp. alg1]
MIWRALLIVLVMASGAYAQNLARLEPDRSSLNEPWLGGVELTLGMSQAVPWRTRMLASPPRLILDFRDMSFDGAEVLAPRKRVTSVRAGTVRPGWSRLVIGLNGPYIIASAVMTTHDETTISLRLQKSTQEAFEAEAERPEPAEWTITDTPAAPVAQGNGPLLVMIDPGHGGIDPGARYNGLSEKNLTLAFAQELRDVLLKDGTFRVALTRESDVFIPLETRLTLAKAAGASLFLSIHADAVGEGEATGATLYTFAPEASDRAARIMAAWHDRTDILSGVDLSDHDDTIAEVLMDMARTNNQPRTNMLSKALEDAMHAQRIRMHAHPRQSADFAVLKSPDTPSVLVELGFMSSEGDLNLMFDPTWRARMAMAVRDGLLDWAAKDAVSQLTIRQ